MTDTIDEKIDQDEPAKKRKEFLNELYIDFNAGKITAATMLPPTTTSLCMVCAKKKDERIWRITSGKNIYKLHGSCIPDINADIPQDFAVYKMTKEEYYKMQKEKP